MACWYIGMALVLNLFIQERIGLPNFASAYPKLYLAGALFLILVLVIAHGVFGNVFLGTAVIWACAVLISYADKIKYSLRMEHVYPGDLEMFFSLDQMESMYDANAARGQWVIVFALLAAGVFSVFFLTYLRKRRARAGLEKRVGWKYAKYRICLRLFLVIAGVALLAGLTWPVRSPLGGDINIVDYDYIAWNQAMNYERNGFVFAFISNLKVVGMTEPDGYSEERVRDIADKYRAAADHGNKGRINLAEEGVDIIYIMNESFCDPDRLTEYYPFTGPSDEVVPNLHDVYDSESSGWIYSPRYGGGTANIEYEALTGMSTYYTGFAYPFQSILPDFESFPSVENLFAGEGYASVGLHSYRGPMYRRNSVYPILGFDAYAGSEDFANRGHDRTSHYISDESAYNETIEWLEGRKGLAAGSYFVTLITMQNHPQYGNQYTEHAFTSLADVDAESRLKIEDYMELLHDSDEALGALIDWASAREKKTAIVFFGDHLPGVYDELFDIDPALAYETPFFIYTNFEENTAVSKSDDLPGVVSPNYISTVFFDRMLAEKPPWYYLLDDVKKDFPILTSAYWQNESPVYKQALSDYQLIEYDMLKGEQFAVEYGMFDIHGDESSGGESGGE